MSRRDVLKSLGTAGAALALGSIDGLLRPARADVSGLGVYAYDLDDGTPLSGIHVHYNGWDGYTDATGLVLFGNTSDIPEHAEIRRGTWGQVKAGFRTAAMKSAARTRSYVQDRVYINNDGNSVAGQDGVHWAAWPDLAGQTENVWIKASLPRNVDPRWGEALANAQFGAIWYVLPEQPDLITYRPQDLPIPVDGDMDTQEDWDRVAGRIAELNNITGEQTYVLAPGNGMPDTETLKTGIYIYHNIPSGNSHTTPIPSDLNYPEWMIGAICFIRDTEFSLPLFNALDKEMMYRAISFRTGGYPNGIFTSSAQPITNFNRAHIATLRKIALRMHEGTNSLIALDYVRPWF